VALPSAGHLIVKNWLDASQSNIIMPGDVGFHRPTDISCEYILCIVPISFASQQNITSNNTPMILASNFLVILIPKHPSVMDRTCHPCQTHSPDPHRYQGKLISVKEEYSQDIKVLLIMVRVLVLE
jgi:hypothetical protein